MAFKSSQHAPGLPSFPCPSVENVPSDTNTGPDPNPGNIRVSFRPVGDGFVNRAHRHPLLYVQTKNNRPFCGLTAVEGWVLYRTSEVGATQMLHIVSRAQYSLLLQHLLFLSNGNNHFPVIYSVEGKIKRIFVNARPAH